MNPHPQRCDTCENTSCEYWEIHPHMSARHDRDTGWTASPGVITFAVGCASHSSIPHTPAQPEAQQRIDAAIKELERLVAFCDKRGFYHQRLKHEKVIALLQAGDQHE